MASPTVTGAMIALFDSSPAYGDVAVSNGLWFGELPAKYDMPWAVLWHLGELPDYNLGTSYSETTKFLFELYHTSTAAVEAIAQKVKDMLDPKQDSSGNTFQPSLSIIGAQSYEVTRGQYNLVPASDAYRLPDGKRVIQANIECQVRVVKALKSI